MLTPLRLAQHGMGMQEATIIQWHKQEGEPFTAGEILVEVEAAKATVEIEAEQAGTLARIIALPDEVVEVGAIIAELEVEGAGKAPVNDGKVAEASPAPEASLSTAEPSLATQANEAVSPAPSPASTFSGQVEPRARRLAEQSRTDLASVTATGPGGRITEEDVRRRLASGSDAAATAGIPLRGLRGTISRKMMQSLQTTAQLTLVREVDVTDLEARRAKLKGDAALSFTTMLVPAVASALQQHPQLNALLEDDIVAPQPSVNIGIAVQTDVGLVVPVIHNAQDADVGEISARLARLADAARNGRADPSEMTGGTFTITNLGAFGIDAFTPILHAPQVAILGVGRIAERYTRTEDGADWRKFVTLSLTFDHRAIDGAPAAEFLRTLSERLSRPEAWLNG